MRDGKPSLLILSHNLEGNGLGRAYLLADLLRDHYDVRITGPSPGGGVWPSCPRGTIPIDVWCDHMPSMKELTRKADEISADVILATKALRNSFGLALLARRKRRFPLVLDVDEWDVPGKGRTVFTKWLRTVLRPWKWWRLWELVLDQLATRADSITVSTSFLQRRYGGAILRHVRDVHRLDPAKVDGGGVRRRLGLEGLKVVLFLGTPRRHKGVEDVGKAVDSLAREDVRFLIVGCRPDDPYVKTLQKRVPSAVLHPPTKMTEAGPFLAAADVVVVPQRDTPFARSQLPAKLIDAMAMGRPIVGTAVSDIPELLEGCGLVVRPGDVKALAAGLVRVFENPEEAAAMGRRAREKAVRELSYEAGRPVLLRAVESAVKRCRRG